MRDINSKNLKIQEENSNQGSVSSICNRIKYALAWWCDNTSLHGFHYISNKESSMLTRIFFAFASCCSFVLCVFLIVLQLYEYQDQSVLTTVRSTAFPVWKIRFPSVTVCNFNIVYKDNVKKVLNVVRANNINEDVFNDMLYNLSALVIYDDLDDMSDYKTVFEDLEKVGYTADRLMEELAHPCFSMIKKCFWQSAEVQCSQIFDFVKTSQGYCCAFNYYGTVDTVDNLENPQKLHFQHVSGAGPNLGLRLLLDVEESQYIASIKPSYGINILVQDGFDYPDMDVIANTILSTQELTISVNPKVYLSSDSVRYLDYEHRRCLFDNEGVLEWTSTYSYKTCISQCKAEAILYFCNCVPYYYPIRRREPICTLIDVPCLRANKYKYNALEIVDNYYAPKDSIKMYEHGNTIRCKCYPECNEQMFTLHTDRATATQMTGFEYSNISVVDVYYNTIGCVKTERDVYFTWDRVIASIGGIFGLCLGGSIISILECLYFFGRVVTNCKQCELPGTSLKSKKSAYPQIYLTDFKLYVKPTDKRHLNFRMVTHGQRNQ